MPRRTAQLPFRAMWPDPSAHGPARCSLTIVPLPRVAAPQRWSRPMSDIPALLVIDVQQSFLHAPYWREDDVPVFRENLLTLIDAAVARGWPVVRILHEDGDAHFSEASGLVTPMAWVPGAHDVMFRKQVHNAFTGT